MLHALDKSAGRSPVCHLVWHAFTWLFTPVSFIGDHCSGSWLSGKKWDKWLTVKVALSSVMDLTKARASAVAERMLSTRPSWKRRSEALSYVDTSLPLHLTVLIWNERLYLHVLHGVYYVLHEWYALLVKCKLQGDLYECIWAHLLFFDKFFSISFKCENIHIKIVHQPEMKHERVWNRIWNRNIWLQCLEKY